jgi:biotin synthase
MPVTNTRLDREQVAALYRSSVLDLVGRAAEVHRRYHAPDQVQICVLLSVKTGGCPEDCGYCPQSAHHTTDVKPQGLLDVPEVVAAARRARGEGATRFCIGAAWREVRDGAPFDAVLEMIRGIKALGLEACCTLGMLTAEQARRLKEAGLNAYNHNLDSSQTFYDKIISTRTYQDRLRTIAHVRAAGISVCCGGIIGMGETEDDRIDLLHTLATLPEPPESVPINALVAVPGTPLGDRPPVEIWEMVRMIATARILMPRAMVRLSAGRLLMTETDQALCFLAGANSIFAGEKLLTTSNPEPEGDRRMFARLGLKPRPARV